MQHPPVSLENLTEPEKETLIESARKNMMRGAAMYLLPFGAFIFAIAYVNNNYMTLGLERKEDLRSVLNVVLVILTVLPARLFVNTVLRYRKAMNAWQKKVFRGKVTRKDGRVIFIDHHKLKLTDVQAAGINVGDEVMIAMSSVADTPLNAEVTKKAGE